MTNAYDANGDMIAREGQRFRRVGWQINGGLRDKQFVTEMDSVMEAHGSFSPVYIKIDD